MTTELNGNTVEFAAEDMGRLRANLADLREAVINKLPHVRNILSIIHKTLREDPDVITMLEPEEVAVVVQGMAHEKGIALEVSAKKASASAKRSASKLTLNDL